MPRVGEDFGMMLNRSLVGEFVTCQGLHALVPRTGQSERTDDFGSIFYMSDNIEIDHALLRFNRGNFQDVIIKGRLLFGDEFNHKEEIRKPEDLLNFLTMFEMYQMGALAERAASQMLWKGDLKNNSPDRLSKRKDHDGILQMVTMQRECEIASLLCELDKIAQSLDDIPYVVIVSPLLSFAMPEFREDRLALESCPEIVLDNDIGDSRVCAMPLTEGKPAVVERHVDYRMAQRPQSSDASCFWTDDGLFSWEIITDKWDYHLSLMTERKIELLAPEQTYLIKITDLKQRCQELLKDK